MSMPNIHTILAAALAATLAAGSPVWAAASDYRFELAGQPAASGKTMVIKVRLVRAPDGKPVSDAIIIGAKLDMSPEGMAEMGAPAKAAPTTEPGVYQVETEPSMAGRWALRLAAKVQGEPETVRGSVTITVGK